MTVNVKQCLQLHKWFWVSNCKPKFYLLLLNSRNFKMQRQAHLTHDSSGQSKRTNKQKSQSRAFTRPQEIGSSFVDFVGKSPADYLHVSQDCDFTLGINFLLNSDFPSWKKIETSTINWSDCLAKFSIFIYLFCVLVVVIITLFQNLHSGSFQWFVLGILHTKIYIWLFK